MSHTLERVYDVEDGVLKLFLTTDHPIHDREAEALDRVAESYLACLDKVRAGPARFRDEDDEAIYELGGEENITAG